MNKTTTILSFLFCLIIISSALTVNAQSSLTVSVSTDKTSYNRADVSSISGDLKYNDQPTTGLVGLLLVDSTQNKIAVRTISAGTVSNPPGAITAVYLSDQAAIPLTSASAGSLAYFTITVENRDTIPRDLLAVVSVYDNNGVPLSSGSTMQTSVPSNGRLTATVSLPIPLWAAAGVAYAYGELYSNWPNQGGYPLAAEASTQFTLGGVVQGSNTPSTSGGSTGHYALAFRLAPRAALGQDRIYVSSTSNGLTTSDLVSFSVNQPFDYSGDGVLDFNDLVGFANNWIAYYNSQSWNQMTDANKDGVIDFNDLIAFANAWIIYYSAA